MATPATTRNWGGIWTAYTDRRVIGMLFLGFSAGLPFPLVFATLSTWLREAAVERTTIGFFAWIGITYSIKVFWSPVVDRAPLPFLTRWFGQRRGWMLLAQAGVVIGLFGMASTNPASQLTAMALFALLVAFSSATQDVSIDAYRIESVELGLQGPMAGMYQSGYRIAAALVGGAGALYLAQWTSWQSAYLVMMACMSVGIITVLLIREPPHLINHGTQIMEQRVIDYLEGNQHLPPLLMRFNAWFIGAVVCPFIDFFRRNRTSAVFILLFIAIYRIGDIVLGNMANPFYIDMQFSKTEIANIGKIYGVLMTILGAMIGGSLVLRFGVMRILLLGAILVSLANLLFAQLAVVGHDLTWLTIVISADNFSGGLAGSAFIAYLSRLTNTAYTATQYALFSSLMTLFPKIISGFSGMIVDTRGYVFFFTYAALLGVPAILMVIYLMYRQGNSNGE
jgi:MFS transporter, PAT family, beta-lactamase induction signal transducer AmpG